jgi:hypothetical protein
LLHLGFTHPENRLREIALFLVLRDIRAIPI